MPPMTKMLTFLQAIRTGSTNTTKRLDAIFADPAALRRNNHFRDYFTKRGHLDSLDAPCKALLALSVPEVDHIDSWPNDLKEGVRVVLVDAVNANRKARFSWNLTTGKREDHLIQIPGTGDINITFLSPESKVKSVGANDVAVNVGPAGPLTR